MNDPHDNEITDKEALAKMTELADAELMDPKFAPVQPNQEEAELLGMATMNLVDVALQLSDCWTELEEDSKGRSPLPVYKGVPEEQAKALHFWAAQLQTLMQQQVAKAGLGMQI